jgi:glycosyltransferase involved in cell wall biosynthesis
MSLINEVEFTLLMPCLNEAETIAVCVRKANTALSRLGIQGEVLVADNGSSDGSQELAKSCGARVITVHEPGYGAALLGGIKAARGMYIIMGDADDSYDWSAIDQFVKELRAGNDIVMGCRLPLGGGKIQDGAMPWLHRWLGNPVLSFLGRLFFGCPVTDFHCGMRGFSRSAVGLLDLNSPGMEFASEMIVKAALKKLRIIEVPITLYPAGRSRAPHLRTFRDGWRHLRFMLIYSPRWLFLWPGLALLMTGAIGFVLLLPGPRVVHGVSLELNTLVVCSFSCLIGTQTLSFGLFARIFAAREGLLSEDFLLSRICLLVKMEHGLLLGAIASTSGIVMLLVATISWARHSFGPLLGSFEQRLVICSLTLLSLGIQVIFSSFFLSMLGLPKSER